MTRAERKKVTLEWLEDKNIIFTNEDADDIMGTCKIYVKETEGNNGRKWQFDLYDKSMDITLSTWDKNNDMKDIHELINIPFASKPEQLDSLMELVNFKIK